MNKLGGITLLITISCVCTAAGRQAGLPEILRPLQSGLQVSLKQYERYNAPRRAPLHALRRRVSVFAETARQAVKPTGYTAFIHWPKVNVPSGSEITVKVMADGKVIPQF